MCIIRRLVTPASPAAPRRAAARKAAGFVARALHTSAGMRVARASPSTLRPSSKMGSYFCAGPKVAMFLILLLGIVSAAHQLLKSTVDLRPFGADFVSTRDRRLQQIKPFLAGQNVVGYIDDRRLDVETLRDYYLTQYSLTPMAVQGGLKYEIVIGNFTKSTPDFRMLNQQNLILLKDCGNGLLLLKKQKS